MNFEDLTEKLPRALAEMSTSELSAMAKRNYRFSIGFPEASREAQSPSWWNRALRSTREIHLIANSVQRVSKDRGEAFIEREVQQDGKTLIQSIRKPELYHVQFAFLVPRECYSELSSITAELMSLFFDRRILDFNGETVRLNEVRISADAQFEQQLKDANLIQAYALMAEVNVNTGRVVKSDQIVRSREIRISKTLNSNS